MTNPAFPAWSYVPVIGAYVWFAVAGVVLAVIDWRTHRLPDRIVLPTAAVSMGCFALAVLLGAPWPRLLMAGVGAVAMFAFYLALRVISRRGVGGGDVKLAAVIGLHLGWVGVTPLVVGLVLAFVLGGLAATVLLALGRATRRTAVAFGPFMLAGAWIAIIAGTTVLHPDKLAV